MYKMTFIQLGIRNEELGINGGTPAPGLWITENGLQMVSVTGIYNFKTRTRVSQNS